MMAIYRQMSLLLFFVTITVGLAIALPLALTLRVNSSNGGCRSMK